MVVAGWNWHIWCRIWRQIQCAYLDLPDRLRSEDTAANVYLQCFSVTTYISRTRLSHFMRKWDEMCPTYCRTILHRENIWFWTQFSHKWRVKQGTGGRIWQEYLKPSAFYNFLNNGRSGLKLTYMMQNLMANPMRLSRPSRSAYFRRYSRKRVFARYHSHRIYLENA